MDGRRSGVLKGESRVTRRQLLQLIGRTAGGAFMYHAMHSLGFAAESDFKGTPPLGGAKPGASVLILGAGLAGMTAAFELRKAGYRVELLEYNGRAGGRSWTIRGGDTFQDLSGEVQRCRFKGGNYFNPGPWRIPYHHRGMLHYCRSFGIKLEPFIQDNQNAYLHSSGAFDGKPQRFRHIRADFQGHVAELLAKCTHQGSLDGELTKEDQDKLLESLRHWGALDAEMKYGKGYASSARRGFDVDSGGGLMPRAEASTPIKGADLLKSELWRQLTAAQEYDYAPSIFQPVGGMDQLARAFEKTLKPHIRYHAKVTGIRQSERRVSVSYVDARKGGAVREMSADWCVCTIPLGILGQLGELQVSNPLREAITAVPYGESYKAGLEFKRRFWEEDEAIYGGVSYTDLPISRLSYPSDNLGVQGPGVMLGAYNFGPNAYEFSAKPHTERIKHVLAFGAQLHPQMPREFLSAVDVAWHRMPFTQGCFAFWLPDTRARHYDNLCAIDGRLVLAGEHASFLPAWQEGAVLSALDAIGRLHAKATA